MFFNNDCEYIFLLLSDIVIKIYFFVTNFCNVSPTHQFLKFSFNTNNQILSESIKIILDIFT